MRKKLTHTTMLNAATISIAATLVMVVSSCNSEKKRTEKIFKSWINHEIKLVDSLPFTVYATDTATMNFKDAKFKIASFIDLTECSTCQLHLDRWKSFIEELDSTVSFKVPVLLYLQPRDIFEVRYALRREAFTYPICIDTAGIFNKTNKLEADERFRTMLLNCDNKVVAIGNPTINKQIKQYYFSILTRQASSKFASNKAERLSFDDSVDLGEFDWRESKTGDIKIKNNSRNTIEIVDIVSSCECLKVNKRKLTLKEGECTALRFTFKTEHSEGSFYREIKMIEKSGEEHIIIVTGISD